MQCSFELVNRIAPHATQFDLISSGHAELLAITLKSYTERTIPAEAGMVLFCVEFMQYIGISPLNHRPHRSRPRVLLSGIRRLQKRK